MSSGETSSQFSWHTEDNIIYITATSDGTDGPGWIERLRKKGIPMTDESLKIIRSEYFNPTPIGTTYQIAIIKSMSGYVDEDWNTQNILAEAERNQWSMINLEAVCLICENISYNEIKEMGILCILAMNEILIKDAVYLFGVILDYRSHNRHWLYAICDPSGFWTNEYGFAFEVTKP